VQFANLAIALLEESVHKYAESIAGHAIDRQPMSLPDTMCDSKDTGRYCLFTVIPVSGRLATRNPVLCSRT